LWVLILYLPVVCLRGTIELLSHEIPRISVHPRRINTKTGKQRFELFLLGYFPWRQDH
jgi:hypothetical protein